MSTSTPNWPEVIRAHAPALPEAVADELAQHLSDLYDEARRQGHSDAAALALATEALPGEADRLVREVDRARRTLAGVIAARWADPDPPPAASDRSAMLGDLGRDLRHAVRLLARTPGFTAVVVLTLALGIGANTLIFSAVDALLLRGAPIGDPDRVVSVFNGSTDGRTSFSTLAFPDYQDIRDSGIFEDAAAFAGIPLILSTGDETVQLGGEVVTGNYFDVLKVAAALGRGFIPGEDVAGQPVRVIVLSDALWRQRFGADRSVVGRAIRINDQVYTVVGVLPRGFTSPILGRVPEAWVPMALQPEVRPPSAGLRRSLGTGVLLGVRGSRWINVVGRLKPGESPAQASAALGVVAKRLQEAYPDSNRTRTLMATALNTGPGARQNAQPLLFLLGATVIAVLLIACSNVASLMVARAVSRRREIAVRLAIGASRSRLTRQWLTEAVLISVIGGATGLAVGYLGIPVLYRIGFPETVQIWLSPNVLLFTLGVSVLTGIVFGLAPLPETFRPQTVDALRDEGGAVATGYRASRLRHAFVIVQVALSLVLLVGAGLFVRTLGNAQHVELGYDVENVVLGDLDLGTRYTPQAGAVFYRRVLDDVRAMGGVRAAALARVVVLSGGARTTSARFEGPVTETEPGTDHRVNVVSEGYFETLGIALVRGRFFSTADTPEAPRVAVVTRRMADAFWPTQDPIGRQFYTGSLPLEVVGVTEDHVYVSPLEANPLPNFYLPLSQNYESGMTLHVRGSSDARSLIPGLRRVVRSADPILPLARPRTFSGERDRALGNLRVMATLVGLFGGVAIALAAIGLYGVMSHAAQQRRSEIGVRMALGAEPAAILRMMIGQGLQLVAIGGALGLIAALSLAGFVRSQLFGISPTDPATFAAVSALLLVVAVVACFVPARRAMRVNPITALRH